MILMKILDDISHRPFPLYSKNWIMRQAWRNLVFLHWPIPKGILRKFIPTPLQIDTFNGYAWLGIVAFVMDGIYPRNIPFCSLIHKFPEVNLRTYVQYRGKPGVFFLSLDVDNWASNIIAKRWFKLPYYPAQVTYEQNDRVIHCESIRKSNNTQIRFKGRLRPSHKIFHARSETLDFWLTERYCLYSIDTNKNVYCGEIHHRSWPLQKVDIEVEVNTLTSHLNIDLSNKKPITHFSTGVDSLIWNIRKVYM